MYLLSKKRTQYGRCNWWIVPVKWIGWITSLQDIIIVYQVFCKIHSFASLFLRQSGILPSRPHRGRHFQTRNYELLNARNCNAPAERRASRFTWHGAPFCVAISRINDDTIEFPSVLIARDLREGAWTHLFSQSLSFFLSSFSLSALVRCERRDKKFSSRNAAASLPGPGARHVKPLLRVLPITSRSLLVLARVKNSALEPSVPWDEHDVVAGVSRAGGAIWRTAHSRAHRLISVSFSLALFPCLTLASPTSPSRYALSPLYLFILRSRLCPPLFLSVYLVLLRSAGSFP